jgi:hypothetical protein
MQQTELDAAKNVDDQQAKLDVAENVDDQPVRGTKFLTDIYSRCNVAEAEPIGFEEVMNSQVWIVAMKEELAIIGKKSNMDTG